MKKNLALRITLAVFMLQICGLCAFAQVELGWSNFPYTAADGNVISASYTGAAQNYSSAWTSCGVTTKANSVWLGSSGVATMTNTFTSPVSTLSYRLTASDPGEQVTFTTNAGTPTVASSGGCSYAASGNIATCSGSNAGTIVTVTSSTAFTSITLSHNGVGNGTLFTMLYSGTASSIPVSPWAVAILFVIISSVGYMMLRKTTALPV